MDTTNSFQSASADTAHKRQTRIRILAALLLFFGITLPLTVKFVGVQKELRSRAATPTCKKQCKGDANENDFKICVRKCERQTTPVQTETITARKGAEFKAKNAGMCGAGSLASYPTACTCSGTDYCFDTTGSCSASNGLCAAVTLANKAGCSDASAGTGFKYSCPNMLEEISGGCQQNPTSVTLGENQSIDSLFPQSYCGTIQIDVCGRGFKSRTYTNGCKTTTRRERDTPTPTKKSTPTPTRRVTNTPTTTATPTQTGTPTSTPTGTPSVTATPTPGASSTPTPTTGIFDTPTPTPPTTPQVPVSGGPSLLGISVLSGGFLLLLLGLAL